ncbi:MAG: response regulator [Acidimicrobiia bacterium]|nr:response regulator [Acidimicrobiia bacterium]
MGDLRVLLLEDDEDHVFLIRRALRDLDGLEVTVDVAANGDDALRYLASAQKGAADGRPQLALLDLKVPKISGLDVLEHIRSSPMFAALPAVMLTSSERMEDRERAQELGASGYLCKPLDGAQLRADVQATARWWADRVGSST